MMAILSDYLLLDVGAVLSLILIWFYYYLASSFNYWKNHNVPFLKPTPIFGNFCSFKHYTDVIKDVYSYFENEKYCGLYQFMTPALVVRDLKLIEHILVKDFTHFEDRGMPMDGENDPLSVNLVNLSGNAWRNLRHKLAPSHTSGKLKSMFEQMNNCGEDMLRIVEGFANTGEKVDTKILTSSFSTEVIASCAFGLQIRYDTSEGVRFTEMVNKALGTSRGTILRTTANLFFPKLAKLFRLSSLPQDVTSYFVELTKATMKHRRQNNIKRKDFLQLLMTLKEEQDSGVETEPIADDMDQEDVHLQYMDKAKPETQNLKFTDEVVAAQSFVFLAAGSEATSTTISVALHHLAAHPEVQRRLQEEVDIILLRHGGRWTYQTIKEMSYLDQIIQESQRLFPIGHVLLRKCTSPYKMPCSDLTIEQGMTIIIPTIALQHDPNYYPDPLKFNPDRFAGNNFKPSLTYLPFGDGPRICIAMKFAILEVKVFLARLFSRYSVTSSTKTISPLQYDPKSYSARPLGGVWVYFQKRELLKQE